MTTDPTLSDAPEIWKPVPGFPGYLVSSLGRVLSEARDAGPNRRARSRPVQEWMLTLQPNSAGTLYVSLSREGKGHVRAVHTLVLLAFMGPCPKGAVSRRKNGRKDDNRLANLAWGTPPQSERNRRRGVTPVDFFLDYTAT
jgi:hypothetical protein